MFRTYLALGTFPMLLEDRGERTGPHARRNRSAVLRPLNTVGSLFRHVLNRRAG